MRRITTTSYLEVSLSAPSYAEELVNTVVDPWQRERIEDLIELMKLRMDNSIEKQGLKPVEALRDALEHMCAKVSHPTLGLAKKETIDIVMKHAKYRLVGYLGLVSLG